MNALQLEFVYHNKTNNQRALKPVIHAVFEPKEGSIYLTELSQRDAKWKELKPQNLAVAEDYAGTAYDKYYDRMSNCSGYLRFDIVQTETGESIHKLQEANFCRVRFCPICQWRRSLMWRSRTIEAMNRILADYPGKRFIYLTLTIKNCPLEDLGATITHMNQSWQRLLKRPQFKAIGWLRNLEVTRQANGDAHPHFHTLLMVNPGYFAHDYLNQKDWTALWRSCLRVEYNPSVCVNVVKPKKKATTDTVDSTPQISEGLLKAIRYTLKYSTKAEELPTTDTVESQDMQAWLIGLTKQMHNKRAIATGGIFKKYLSESEPENLVTDDGNNPVAPTGKENLKIQYLWDDSELDYLFHRVLHSELVQPLSGDSKGQESTLTPSAVV